MNDISNALTRSIAVNGESAVTGHIPFGGNRITFLGDPVAPEDAVNLRSLQGGLGNYAGAAGGTVDAVTISPTPGVTALSAGMRFSFIASGKNTGNVTLSVSGLTAKELRRNGTIQLAANTLFAGVLAEVVYDGTYFQLVNIYVISFSGGSTGLTSTFDSGVITLAGTLAVGNGGTGVTTSTGSTNVVSGTYHDIVWYCYKPT